MVMNDIISPMVLGTCAGPMAHLTPSLTRLGCQGAVWLEGGSSCLNLGRRRGTCLSGCWEPRRGCTDFAHQPSAEEPSLITCQFPHSSWHYPRPHLSPLSGVMVMDDLTPARLLG